MPRDSHGSQTGHPHAGDPMQSSRSGNIGPRWLGVSSRPVALTFADLPALLMVCGLAGAYAWWAGGFFRDDAIWSIWSSLDAYFHSDIPSLFQIYAHGIPEALSHFILHPLLFPIVWFAGALGRRLGVPLVLAFRALLSAASALAALLLYLCARGTGTQPALAALGVLATTATAAFTHWSGTPDHFALSVPTIALPLAMLAATQTKRVGFWIPTAVVSGTVTVSNAVMGLLAVLARLGVAPGLVAFAVAVLGLTALAGAWLLHVRLVVGRTFSNLDNPLNHLRFFHFLPSPDPTHQKTWDGDFPFDLGARLKALSIYQWTAPELEIRHRFFLKPEWMISPTVLSYDTSPLVSLGWSGGVAALAFAALFALGLASAARSPRRDVAVAAIGFLAFHTLLHLFYGELVFLYAAHAIPSLAAIIAFALAGPWRRPASLLALAFVLVGGPHNIARFREAADLATLIARINRVGAEP